MISKRLTKIQKDEILEAYRGGENASTLADKYGCTSNTINRTVKNLLSDNEYKLLKEKRLKTSSRKVEELLKDKSFDNKKEDFEKLDSVDLLKTKVKEDNVKEKNDDSDTSDFEEIAFLPMNDMSLAEEHGNQDPQNKLEEIVPLTSSFDLQKKEDDFDLLNQEVLPESVYMLVDKKVELEVKTISDFPEWSFLPENELRRNALLLFSSQRTAKRSCNRNQRVIKIPNKRVFEVSKSYLLSKGITRLIIEDSIIALDK